MEAVVLAGGFGTRLRSVVSDLPKPMAPIAGRPFLEILLNSLADKGFTSIVLSLGYMADAISGHFGATYRSMNLKYAIEDVPLGTGGAVRLALEQCSEPFVFVFNGDTFLDLEVGALVELWRQHGNPVVVGREVPDTARFGRLLVSDGRLTGFSEKGLSGPGLINAGCYLFNLELLRDFPLHQPFSLEADYLVPSVQLRNIDAFITQGYFIDIGIPEDFERAQVELARY